MKKKEENNNTIEATFTEKQELQAIGAGAAEPTGTEATGTAGTPSTEIQAAAVAIRKLSDENAVLRYKLSKTELTEEKINEYLQLVSFIIPDDMKFGDVKQKIRDNMALILKFAGGGKNGN